MKYAIGLNQQACQRLVDASFCQYTHKNSPSMIDFMWQIHLFIIHPCAEILKR